MSWWLILAAYLLGSISFSLLLVSLLEKEDIRSLGSGNAGATNVLRVSGTGAAVLTLILDIGKGALPIWMGERLGVGDLVLGASAVAVVLGHMYPVYHGFRGGKGVATAAGALGALEPLAIVGVMALFLIVVLTTRFVSLASMAGVAGYPLAVVLVFRGDGVPWWLVSFSGVIALLVLYRHRANLSRLLSGTERRLGEPRSAV